MDPWLIIGDLHELFSLQEKYSNNEGNSTRYIKLKQMLDENGLINLGCFGLPFTWHNNRPCAAAVFERFDRAWLINSGLTYIKMQGLKIYLLLGLIMAQSSLQMITGTGQVPPFGLKLSYYYRKVLCS